MLIWVNGPFGVGKTATAEELVRRVDGAVLVDPERIGLGLQHAIPDGLRPDFQDLTSWPVGVVEVLDHTLRRHPGPVVAPMTVVAPRYLDQTVGSLRRLGRVVHDVSRSPRAPPSSGACGLADERVTTLVGLRLDTTDVGLDEVVEHVAASAGLDLPTGRAHRAVRAWRSRWHAAPPPGRVGDARAR